MFFVICFHVSHFHQPFVRFFIFIFFCNTDDKASYSFSLMMYTHSMCFQWSLAFIFGRMSPHLCIRRVSATLISLRSQQDSFATQLLQMTLDYKKISYFENRWQPDFCLLVFRCRFLLFSWELPLTASFAQSHQQMRQFVMHKKPHSGSHLSPCVCYHALAVCFRRPIYNFNGMQNMLNQFHDLWTSF